MDNSEECPKIYIWELILGPHPQISHEPECCQNVWTRYFMQIHEIQNYGIYKISQI